MLLLLPLISLGTLLDQSLIDGIVSSSPSLISLNPLNNPYYIDTTLLLSGTGSLTLTSSGAEPIEIICNSSLIAFTVNSPFDLFSVDRVHFRSCGTALRTTQQLGQVSLQSVGIQGSGSGDEVGLYVGQGAGGQTGSVVIGGNSTFQDLHTGLDLAWANALTVQALTCQNTRHRCINVRSNSNTDLVDSVTVENLNCVNNGGSGNNDACLFARFANSISVSSITVNLVPSGYGVMLREVGATTLNTGTFSDLLDNAAISSHSGLGNIDVLNVDFYNISGNTYSQHALEVESSDSVPRITWVNANCSLVGSLATSRYGSCIHVEGHSGLHVQLESSNFVSNAAGHGGAVFIQDAGTVNISDAVFRDNTAAQSNAQGGALVVVDVSGVHIRDTVFQRNKGQVGSSVHIAGFVRGNSFVDSVTMENVLVDESTCDSSSNNCDGSIFLEYVFDAVFRHLYIYNATVAALGYQYDGSGIQGIISNSLLLEDSEVRDATCRDGCAINLFVRSPASGHDIPSPNVTLRRSTFSGLRSEDGYDGGAVHLSSAGAVEVDNCTFTGITSAGSGGAFYHSDSYYDTPATLHMSEVIFEDNSAEDHGGSISTRNLASVVLSDVMVRRSTSTGDGGAVSVDAPSSSVNTTVVIRGCIFEECQAIGPGGALRLYETGDVLIVDSAVRRCSGSYGGGAYIRGTMGNLAIDSCSFDANWASVDGGALYLDDFAVASVSDSELSDSMAGDGGGLFIDDVTSLVLSDMVFHHNTARDWGGGVCDHDVERVLMSRCNFTENVAIRIAGGGAYLYYAGEEYSNVSVSNSEFHHNYAGRYGGGLRAGYLSDLNIERSLFAHNAASESGGGMYMSMEPYKRGTLQWNTFVDNYAGSSGGGLYFHANHATAYVYRSNFLNNARLDHVSRNRQARGFDGFDVDVSAFNSTLELVESALDGAHGQVPSVFRDVLPTGTGVNEWADSPTRFELQYSADAGSSEPAPLDGAVLGATTQYYFWLHVNLSVAQPVYEIAFFDWEDSNSGRFDSTFPYSYPVDGEGTSFDAGAQRLTALVFLVNNERYRVAADFVVGGDSTAPTTRAPYARLFAHESTRVSIADSCVCSGPGNGTQWSAGDCSGGGSSAPVVSLSGNLTLGTFLPECTMTFDWSDEALSVHGCDGVSGCQPGDFLYAALPEGYAAVVETPAPPAFTSSTTGSATNGTSGDGTTTTEVPAATVTSGAAPGTSRSSSSSDEGGLIAGLIVVLLLLCVAIGACAVIARRLMHQMSADLPVVLEAMDGRRRGVSDGRGHTHSSGQRRRGGTSHGGSRGGSRSGSQATSPRGEYTKVDAALRGSTAMDGYDRVGPPGAPPDDGGGVYSAPGLGSTSGDAQYSTVDDAKRGSSTAGSSAYGQGPPESPYSSPPPPRE